MNTAMYPRKELTFASTHKKVDSVGTTAVSYIIYMNTSSGPIQAMCCQLYSVQQYTLGSHKGIVSLDGRAGLENIKRY